MPTLTCLLIDHQKNAIQPPFIVDVPSDAFVHHLKMIIKEEYAHILPDVSPRRLRAWWLCTSQGLKDIGPLNTFVRQLLLPDVGSYSIGDDTQASPLNDTDPISELGDLPMTNLHVIVQVPDLPHSGKRLFSPSSDLKETRRGKKIPEHIANFHCKIWDNRDAHSTVFVTTPIQRGDPPLTDVQIPTQCCVMKSPSYGDGSTGLSGIFIRDEYVLAVENIVALYKGKNLTNNPMRNDDEAMEICVDLAESSVAQTQFPVSIANPFLASDFPLKRKKTGVIITGAPGIGKSVLLEIILHLRNLAGHPTIFVLDDKHTDLFTSDGVSRFEGSEIDESQLPRSLWILIDSNADLVDVPVWVRRLGRFIVQAASPRPNRMKWKDKVSAPVSLYFLKMWSLQEILAARMLQEVPPSEHQLQTFLKNYAPSARTAYHFASDIQAYDDELLSRIDELSLNDITNMVLEVASLRVENKFPHRLFIIEPGETRGSLTVDFASGYVYEKVLAALETQVEHAAYTFFRVLNRNSATKVLAGRLLDTVVRGGFTRPGWWPIRQMEVSKTSGKKYQHYKVLSSQPYVEKYFVVGHPDLPLVWVSDERPQNNIAYNRLVVFGFHGATANIITGYHLPVVTNQPTFDSFYYDAETKQATVLQVTVGTTHSMNVKGLDQLQKLGVKSVRYVIVTGEQGDFDLPVPLAYEDLVTEKYYLVVPDPS